MGEWSVQQECHLTICNIGVKVSPGHLCGFINVTLIYHATRDWTNTFTGTSLKNQHIYRDFFSSHCLSRWLAVVGCLLSRLETIYFSSITYFLARSILYATISEFLCCCCCDSLTYFLAQQLHSWLHRDGVARAKWKDEVVLSGFKYGRMATTTGHQLNSTSTQRCQRTRMATFWVLKCTCFHTLNSQRCSCWLL